MERVVGWLGHTEEDVRECMVSYTEEDFPVELSRSRVFHGSTGVTVGQEVISLNFLTYHLLKNSK